MSHYDHATLLALKLGPWANPAGTEQSTTGREIEAAFIEMRQSSVSPPSEKPRTAPVAALIGFLRPWFRAG